MEGISKGGCYSKRPDPYGVGLWKGIFNVVGAFPRLVACQVNNGEREWFWHNPWCSDVPLLSLFPLLLTLASNKDGSVKDHKVWNLQLGETLMIGKWGMFLNF